MDRTQNGGEDYQHPVGLGIQALPCVVEGAEMVDFRCVNCGAPLKRPICEYCGSINEEPFRKAEAAQLRVVSSLTKADIEEIKRRINRGKEIYL